MRPAAEIDWWTIALAVAGMLVWAVVLMRLLEVF
jgi:hypothetical protein